MERLQVKVTNEVGLHARPASVFVKTANQFESNTRVRNVTADNEWVNAKSILEVLTLGVEQNHEIELEIEGSDEAEAAEKLKHLIESELPE